jgi:hypothetical protein
MGIPVQPHETKKGGRVKNFWERIVTALTVIGIVALAVLAYPRVEYAVRYWVG